MLRTWQLYAEKHLVRQPPLVSLILITSIEPVHVNVDVVGLKVVNVGARDLLNKIVSLSTALANVAEVRIRTPTSGRLNRRAGGIKPRHRRSTANPKTVSTIKASITSDSCQATTKPRSHEGDGKDAAGSRITKKRRH